MKEPKEPTNAMALRYALKSDFPELRREAIKIIKYAYLVEENNVTHAARRLRIGRNAMTRFIQEVEL